MDSSLVDKQTFKKKGQIKKTTKFQTNVEILVLKKTITM